jgi:hypothetical protein
VENTQLSVLSAVAATTADWYDVARKSINVLPADVLLEIFTPYLSRADTTEAWCTLVHVCQTWRNVVFASPRSLDLQLLCTDKTPAAKMLDVWPALPIVVSSYGFPTWAVAGADNIVAALQHRDRVCEINLQNVPSILLERFVAAMQDPFPALTYLHLESTTNNRKEPVSVITNSFLGGSASRLQRLHLDGVPFLAVPKLLLSAGDLVDVGLVDVPHCGYIPPEKMAACLSQLSRLESLHLGFRSPRSRPGQARPPPPTRAVLPALTRFQFKGVTEYLEDFVARIDAPQLHVVEITFFNQLIFNTPQLLRLIDRTDTLKAFIRADAHFFNNFVEVRLWPPKESVEYMFLSLRISCKHPYWQLSSLSQICNLSLPPISTLKSLQIICVNVQLPWGDETENTQWLDLLRPFSFVEDLRLPETISKRVSSALRGIAREPVTEVLPELRDIYAFGSEQDLFRRFGAARRRSGHPITVHDRIRILYSL